MTGVSWAADTIAADCVASLPDGPPTQMRIRNRWSFAGHINVPEMMRCAYRVIARTKTEAHFVLTSSPKSKGISMVGATGFEPATTRPPVRYATRLRYAPT